MKKALYYITIVSLILASCDPMQDINNELEEMDTGYKGSFTIELTSDDYSDIGDLAIVKNSADTLNAAFISSNEYFNDEVTAANYIPLLIPDIYPALGRESSGMITYNYNGTLPDDLTSYTDADEFELKGSTYSSIDEVLDYSGYFSPGYPPEVYIPEILSDTMEAAEDGDIVLVKYMYSEVDPQFDFGTASDVVLFLEGFTEEANGIGQFTATSVAGDQGWVWDQYGDGNAKMSGYSGGAVANEDWLISDAIDLSGFSEASLYVNQALNFLNGEWDQISINISTDYDGADIAGASWDTVYVFPKPAGDNWNFIESGAIDISSYTDQNIFIGFKYISSDLNASTWEVAEVKVTTPGSVTIIGKEPTTYRDFYVYEDGDWLKDQGAYNCNAADYDAMGSPGNYNNFSGSDKPNDYIPGMLSARFPLAGQDEAVIVVYKYYAGSTLTLASTYTNNNGSWESSYDYVVAKSAQFLYGGSGWVFDPTISLTMVSADFQMIVDWVADNVPGEYVDSYGTAETYFGAAAYYVNFDLRTTNYETGEFDSWEDAVGEALAVAFLPSKYPNATTQVNGVDMYYIVNFDTYSGAAGNYSMKFQVTKSGPDPEFTLIEGPY